MLKSIRIFFIVIISSPLLFAQNIPISVGIKSSKDLDSALYDLRKKLIDCSGFSFSIMESDSFSGKGIHLTLSENADHTIQNKLKNHGPEAFYIKGSLAGLYIVGNSESGIKNAVYHYLKFLGFRYFFPHPDWIITPKTTQIFKDVEIIEEPDFRYRRIWYARGTNSNKASKDYQNWFNFNSLGGSIDGNIGHSYENIIKRNKKTFEEHPEYLALDAKGKREFIKSANPKFCFSNEGLIKVCIKDAFYQIEKKKEKGEKTPTISMEPSDGWNTCHCEHCKKIGNSSDRVFYLANRVAKEVKSKYPEATVGLLAYASHAEPTTISLEDNVFVLVATAYNQTKHSVNDLIDLWSKKSKLLGIYDYYGNIDWDWDMPGKPAGSDPDRIRNQIKNYTNRGVIALTAESNIGWISRGPAHYLATQLMWDNKADADSIMADFYQKSFGDAKKQIKELYSLWRNSPSGIPPSSILYQSLFIINEASKNASNDEIRRRIDQYKYYLHFVILFKNYNDDVTPENEYKLFNFIWRIRSMGVCASYPIILKARVNKKNLPGYKPANSGWKQKEQLYSKEELDRFFKDDMASFNNLQGIKTFSPGKDFTKQKITFNLPTEKNIYLGTNSIIFKIEDSQKQSLKIGSGFYRQSPNNTQIAIFKSSSSDTLLFQSFKPDKKLHEIDLKHLTPGLYTMKIIDDRTGYKIQVENNLLYLLEASAENKMLVKGKANFSFYVPSGIKKFLAFKYRGNYTMISPTGRKIAASATDRTTVIQVRENEDGIWIIKDQTGAFYLEGILPYVSTSSDAALIPKTE